MSIHSSAIAALGARPWLLEGQGRMEQTLALAIFRDGVFALPNIMVHYKSIVPLGDRASGTGMNISGF